MRFVLPIRYLQFEGANKTSRIGQVRPCPSHANGSASTTLSARRTCPFTVEAARPPSAREQPLRRKQSRERSQRDASLKSSSSRRGTLLHEIWSLEIIKCLDLAEAR